MVESEMLGDLVLVDDLAHAHADLVLAPVSLPATTRALIFCEIGLGRCQQIFALVRAQFGQVRIAAGHQALARVVRRTEFEQIALIEQAQLQMSLLDQGADRCALQGA